MRNISRVLTILTVAALPVRAQERDLISSGDWDITDTSSTIEQFMGRTALRLNAGRATLADVDFENGTIEFDMIVSDLRAFVGFQFRGEGREAENIYFRPHKSGQWDAIQYQALMNGSSTWQLYHGQGYSGTADIPSGEWFHVELRVMGPRARLFVNGSTEPALDIAYLERGRSRGGFRFTAGAPGAPEGFYAAFSNLRITPDDRPTTYPDRERVSENSGYLTHWSVSDPVAVADEPISWVPELSSDVGWNDLWSDPSGMVNLTRHFRRVQDADMSAVVATVRLRSDSEQVKRLDVGYSDRISVFLNSEVLYSGANLWNSRYPLFLGLISADYESVYLHLNEGVNELTLVVSEAFAGWGFIARLADLEGIEVVDG